MNCSRNILDLRSKGSLSDDDAKWMTENSGWIIDAYGMLVQNLIKENKLTNLELLLNVTCRNPYTSSLLICIFRLELLKHRLSEYIMYDDILVDCCEMKILVKELLIKNKAATEGIKVSSGHSTIFKVVIINIFKSLYGFLSDFFWSRVYRVKQVPPDNIIFIDNFITPQTTLSDGKFVDRYYSGFESYLGDDDRELIWFSPTLSNVRTQKEYKQIFSKIKASKNNLLIQESWLTVIDYFFALRKSLEIPRKVRKVSRVLGHDFTGLITREAREQLGSFSLVKTINKYRFIRRLSLADIKISGAVDWNENQVIDRALNLGLRAFYPTVHVRGYQCFMVPDYYACLEPMEFEKTLGTLPHSYHVFGPAAPAARIRVREFMEVRLAPAFRFSYLYDIQRKRADPAVILFAMSIFLDESQRLMDMCASLLAESDETYEIIVKIHPTVSLDEFKKIIPATNTPSIKFTDLGFAELLPAISVLISASSSVCSEAALIGIPVAILGSPSGPTMNPIPAGISEESSAICYSLRDLQAFLGRIESIDNREIALSEIIQPVSADGTKQLFLFRRDEDTL